MVLVVARHEEGAERGCEVGKGSDVLLEIIDASVHEVACDRDDIRGKVVHRPHDLLDELATNGGADVNVRQLNDA